MSYLKSKGLKTLAFSVLATLSFAIPNDTFASEVTPEIPTSHFADREGHATRLAERVSNDNVKMVAYRDPFGTMYEGVGKVNNIHSIMTRTGTSLGTGTGFVIDDYTYLTTAHGVKGIEGTPYMAVFRPNHNAYKQAPEFKGKRIKVIPGTDVAIVNTYGKLTDYTKPMKLEPYVKSENMRTFEPLTSVGYPSGSPCYSNKPCLMNGYYLNSDGLNIATKMDVEFGASGSPVLNLSLIHI